MVLNFGYVNKIPKCNLNQMEADEQYFAMMLFIGFFQVLWKALLGSYIVLWSGYCFVF